MIKFYIIMSMFLLTSCSSFSPEKPKQETKVPIPESLLVECDKIDKLESKEMGELLRHDTNLMYKYKECAIRHKRLKDAISK